MDRCHSQSEAITHAPQPRDLRKLDSLTPNLVPLILTRRSCILVSMLHIRALIKPDRIIVFDSAGSTESEVSRKFKWHLERNIKAGLATQEEGDVACEEEEIGLVYEHRYATPHLCMNFCLTNHLQGTGVDTGCDFECARGRDGVYEASCARLTGRSGR